VIYIFSESPVPQKYHQVRAGKLWPAHSDEYIEVYHRLNIYQHRHNRAQ